MSIIQKNVVGYAIILLGVLAIYKVPNVFKPPPLPTIEETWWGKGAPSTEDTSIRSFQVNVSNEV